MISAEKEGGLFGVGSMPVPNLQALAANIQSTEIPDRYVPEFDEDDVLDDSSDDIPVIDLGRLMDPDLSEDEASKLNMACEEWGFFQVVNHGIPDEVIDQVKVNMKEFFQLPLKIKEAVAQLPGDVEGYGQTCVVSENQKLEWADMLFFVTLPTSSRTMSYWPTHPSTFRDAMHNYSAELKKVADCLFGSISKNLGLDSDKLADMFKKGQQSMRTNYIPPCPVPEKVLGLFPHSDAVGLTLLLHVNDVQALQISRNGAWLPVKPLPGALVVNVGDIIEIMSNGKYKSIRHRVTVSNEKERLSIAGFHTLSFGDIVGPMPELVKGGEVLYKTMGFDEYMRIFFSSKQGTKFLDSMKLKE